MHRILRSSAALALTSLSLLGACRSKGTATSGESAAGATSAAGSLEGPRREDTSRVMTGMQGMQSMMSGGMMDSMQSHLRMMEGKSADQMKAMLPEHRRIVANMLSQMNSEMRQMNMLSDPKWTAVSDSVRQDLVRMPEMTASDLHSFLAEHSARVMRLMEMHRSMMNGTKR